MKISRVARFSTALNSSLKASSLLPSAAQTADYFTAQAREAGESRFWAGIHFRSDIEAGLEIGRAVAQKVIERARNDGSQ